MAAPMSAFTRHSPRNSSGRVRLARNDGPGNACVVTLTLVASEGLVYLRVETLRCDYKSVSCLLFRFVVCLSFELMSAIGSDMAGGQVPAFVCFCLVAVFFAFSVVSLAECVVF